MLDTEVSNYSFGSLQKILRLGIKKVGMDGIDRILLLGMGGGSVIVSLREEFGSEAEITAVEIDPQIIQIAKNDFQIERFAKLNIVEADAAEFVERSSESFDMIIVDLFVGNTVPKIFTQAAFINKIGKLLDPNGKLIYNTMVESMPEDTFLEIQNNLKANDMDLNIFKNVELGNHLIIGKKV